MFLFPDATNNPCVCASLDLNKKQSSTAHKSNYHSGLFPLVLGLRFIAEAEHSSDSYTKSDKMTVIKNVRWYIAYLLKKDSIFISTLPLKNRNYISRSTSKPVIARAPGRSSLAHSGCFGSPVISGNAHYTVIEHLLPRTEMSGSIQRVLLPHWVHNHQTCSESKCNKQFVHLVPLMWGSYFDQNANVNDCSDCTDWQGKATLWFQAERAAIQLHSH